MQISKMSLMICAAAISASPLLVHAADTDAQAKMRDALRQKMATTTTQSPAASNAGNAAKPVATPSVSAVKPSDPEAQNKLREALRVKMADSQAQTQAQTATTAKSSQPVTPPKPQQSAAPKTETKTPVAVAKPATVPAKPKATTAKPADTSLKTAEGEAMKQAASVPVFNSDLPISADKQQRLNALLEQYKADKVTPQQYHEQRAKILAEP